jgi:hypothetical protein
MKALETMTLPWRNKTSADEKTAHCH